MTKKRTKHSLQFCQKRIFILCWLAYAVIYFGRVNLSVAIPDIQIALHLTKAQVGLIGTSFFWVYGIGQLINGYFGDKIPSRIFVFIGLAVTGLANVLFGLSNSLTLMMVIWSFNGYFQSMLWGPISKTLSFWFAHEKRNRIAVGISTSMVAGYLLAWGASGKVLAVAGWRWAFITPGAFILLVAPLWLALIWSHPEDAGLECPNVHAQPLKTDVDGEPPQKLSLFSVIMKTRLWFVVLACLAQGVIKEGIGLWGPTFLSETHNIGMESTAMVILFIPVMNFAGMMMAGWLNSVFHNQEKLAAAVLFGAGMVAIIGLLFLGPLNIALALLFLGLASAAMFGVNTLLLSVLPLGFARYNKVSSIAGFLDFCSYMAAGLASALTGALAGGAGWSGVIWLWLGCTVMGAGSLAINWRADEKRAALPPAV